MTSEALTHVVRSAAISNRHWERFFAALRAELPGIDRVCAALQLDPYTAYLPRVAQVPELTPYLGGIGLYADREESLTFEVLDAGHAYLATPADWNRYSDLAFYGVAVRSSMKFPVSLGSHPAVLNLWSREPDSFTPRHLHQLEPIVAKLGLSPFRLELAPVGLALRAAKALMQSRQAVHAG
nr:hypothetical protein [uncultured Halomonas sp.]